VRPSAERLAGTGLAIAAATILALALVMMFELDREAELHRDVISRLHAKDSLEALRVQLGDLAFSARMESASPGTATRQAIARRLVEIDAELAYLATHPARDPRSDEFDRLAHAARALAVNARSVRPGDRDAGIEIERLAALAGTALARTLEAHDARINERTLAQIRVGETLRRYVSWLVAGSIVVLVGLFGFYLWVKAREQDARQRIEHIAHHDTVTGLPNRARLADVLAHELARSRRSGMPFSILMLDLDGFKQVNDTWGHAAGDALLAAVAARARQSMRASDTVGRMGGDEFLAILPETSAAGAMEVAEKLRSSLSADYPLDRAVATIGASVGLAVFPEHGADGEALLRAADAALYAAKAAGKNLVRIAPAPKAATETVAEALGA
jgi:diguanylate cyclase (GGDEF)-like protein